MFDLYQYIREPEEFQRANYICMRIDRYHGDVSIRDVNDALDTLERAHKLCTQAMNVFCRFRVKAWEHGVEDSVYAELCSEDMFFEEAMAELRAVRAKLYEALYEEDDIFEDGDIVVYV